ncbi:MAG: uroporphyrinogen decarboxylase [Bacteroidales bacterium]|nr:uroporphyrinogen decarboxylase [Bacteroidales bacterium]MBN2756225.1 uroporphyrinogen decarboxylase [Bacteroidales bacterium]
MQSILLDTLKGKTTERPPVWYMRQAGRILPSYMALKEKHSFWEMMQSPELAAKVTLLPVHDLGVDAAILFSDILVIPYAMGMGLEFTDKGPVFDNPIKNMENPLANFHPDEKKLDYIYNAIDEILKTRPENTPLIGFCGAPLTVLSFMIQGLGSRSNFSDAVKYIFKEKETTKKIIDVITVLSITYAKNQIKHGVEVFQLFETNSDLIPNELYFELFMPAVKKISKAVRETGTPFIFFPKGFGTGISEINYDICDFVSVDWQTPINVARKLVDKKVGLQGNLDPRILYADKKSIEIELNKYLEFGRNNQNWIFNLGHGFLPDLPFENAKFITDWVKNQNWR